MAVTASATDTDGTITKVDFYEGSTLLKSDTSSPYSVTWSNAAAGSYQLTAIATDNDGATTTSHARQRDRQLGDQSGAVGRLVVASLGGILHGAGEHHAERTASDTDGTVARVEFYRGSTLIGSDTTSPYSAVWTGATAGSYSLTARAVDDDGATRTSTAVNITVTTATNQLPTVSITSPIAGQSFTAPASLTITAAASDTDGTISGVDFYVGTQLVGTDTSSPYSAAWSNVAAGSYSLTAVARDNSGGTRTSAAIAVTVTAVAPTPTSGRVRALRGSRDQRHVLHGGALPFGRSDYRRAPSRRATSASRHRSAAKSRSTSRRWSIRCRRARTRPWCARQVPEGTTASTRRRRSRNRG